MLDFGLSWRLNELQADIFKYFPKTGLLSGSATACGGCWQYWRYYLSSFSKVPIVELGQKSALQISDILLKSCAGFLNYNIDYLAKLGIFAAYCAHGLLSISYRCSTLSVDGIEARIHYWIPDSQGIILNPVEELRAIADNAHTWYQTYGLSVQANTFARCIAEGISKGGGAGNSE